MNQLEAMRAFCIVADEGSFTEAAAQMRISVTMVSKHIKQLEQHLGTRLLTRHTRKVQVTQAGQHYRQHVRPIIKKLDLVETQVANFSELLSGRLTITASIEFGSQYLAPVLAGFQAQYPDIQLNTDLTNQPVDLYNSDIDLAIRVAPGLKDASHIAQTLTHSRLSLWASPTYLAKFGTPDEPEQLQQHRNLFFDHSIRKDHWIFHTQAGRETLKLPWLWRSNNGRLLNEAAAQGIGIIQAPAYSVSSYVNLGQLQELMPEYSINPLTISLIYPHKNELPNRTRAFIDYAKQYFKEHPVP